jgi:hypothetical protein
MRFWESEPYPAFSDVQADPQDLMTTKQDDKERLSQG